MAEATRHSRALSVSSAGTASSAGAYSFIPRYTPKPEPAYISASAAADHIIRVHRDEAFDLISPAASPTNEAATFSEPALALLNQFLDSLLYNFLAKAKGTKLPELREGIMEVLKTRLGKLALEYADVELEGLVGDDEPEVEVASMTNGSHDAPNGKTANTSPKPRRGSSNPDWHLEIAFKRMRLRVMVFIRLGDFDDDDEDKFLEEDEESTSSPDMNFSASPAPVFLASVLEYIAEEALTLAGEAAYSRARTRARKTIKEDSMVETFDEESLVVEESDVERIALNSTFARLWRTFRRNHRSITSPASPSRTASRRGSVTSPTRSTDEVLKASRALHKNSNEMIKEESDSASDDIPHYLPTETDIAANIPLPSTDRDVDEIEIPGIAQVIYDQGDEQWDDEEPAEDEPKRPRSASFVLPGFFVLEQVPTPDAEKDVSDQQPTVKPPMMRKRSSSVPSAITRPWDWIPPSVRRALARFTRHTDEYDLACNTPLPDDVLDWAIATPLPADDQERAIATTAAVGEERVKPEVASGEVKVDEASLPTASDSDKAAQPAGTPETSKDKLDSPHIGNSENAVLPTTSEPAQVSKPQPNGEKALETQEAQKAESMEKSSSKGLIAGAAATAAAGAAVAGVAALREGTKSTADHAKNPSLSVQTREPFEPDEADSVRQSLDVRPGSISHPVQSSPEIGTSTKGDAPVKKQVSFAEPEPEPIIEEKKPLASMYAPRKPTTQWEDTRSRSPAYGTQTKTDAKPYGREPSPGKAPVDSKVASPTHIASQATAAAFGVAAAAAGKAAIDGTSSRAATSGRPGSSRGSTPRSDSKPGSSGSGSATGETPPAIPRKSSARDGPPLPLQSTGSQPVNPYAMLYDDIEPDMIGVAQTANVPIHSSSPSLSTESRPWTPNRGASPRNTPDSQKTHSPNPQDRHRNVPSPLRVGRDEKTHSEVRPPSSHQHQAQTTTKGVVNPPSTDEYDLNKPINPERFQNWNRPKESPTLPRFYNQPLGTPTEAQRPPSGSHSQAQHSPKGSQGSQKSQKSGVKRASEELKQQQFDALLDRKETVKYTLTPEEIRDQPRKVPSPIDTTKKTSIPSSRSPIGAFRRNKDKETKEAPPEPKPQPKQEPRERPPLKISDIKKGIAALDADPVEPKTRKGLQAREPRVLGGSTKDFVDFIRSCAPTSPDQTQPPVLSHRLSQNGSLNLGLGSSQNGGLSSANTAAKRGLVAREPDRRPARDDDLLDFIRAGPEGMSGGRTSKQSRTSGPLRSTMDSDDFGLLSGAGSSAHNSVMSRPSVTDSYTSNSPLMSRDNRDKPLPNPKSSALAPPAPQITRKTHRNKDPYAIDSDDEETDDFTALPSRSNGGGSESLAEFLRATSPGPSSRVNGNSGSSREPLNFRAPVNRRNGDSTRHTSNPIPAASHSGSLSNRSGNSTGGGLMSGIGSLNRKKMEARPAGATRGFGGDGYYHSTNDLADYLRTSGPPGGMGGGGAANGSARGRMSAQGSVSGSGRVTPSGESMLKKSDSTRKRLWGRKAVAA